ncbi:uncharacterized protein CANTADRAFT_44130 [Suhomyces tanzawaensis NRRL Y-17324]|uniref:Mitochondrial distribution and morphology protein 34 n=1 Tax=Suhomyces tanzawaensis NRRL Y-17324 TaxID=984487 RepID=A0A1E4SPC1_9ASCO|nr:uncharacterized protein CANTADRAFT_44130 [Suhomyces tanzawaensis NRRL Y-17324]ODV81374.1 hypothetical protein CANTADRAFT_44130 [Suhomyces tanzawaensis NRRL Y-17324]
MSFQVNWNTLESDNFSCWTKELLTTALNLGKSPNILASGILIKDLNFGKVAPNFEILEIGELDRDRFRGIFKINYEGDFHLTLHTKVQANPLNIYYSNSLDKEVGNSTFVTPEFGLSNEQFALPMDLKLSDIKISGIGIIVFSKTKGLTLVFRNDPLDSIKVSSTFDTVQVLANFLQKQIENQIRDLFRETLPTLIHQLSLNYLSLDNINDIHSKLSINLAADLNLGTTQLPTDLPFVYSSKNLQKNLKLFNSRETLSLNVPKLKNVIQRSHLDKLNKHVPNLSNSLYSILNEEVGPAANSNGIPVEMLINKNFSKTDTILSEISTIQTNSYYRVNNSKNNNVVRPKRRTVKLGKKKTTSSTQPVASVPVSELTSQLSETESEYSDTSTLINEPVQQEPIVVHPKPIRLSRDLYHELMKPYPELKAERPPLRAEKYDAPNTSSLLTSVGLGTSYFNFPNSQPISTSPLRKELRDRDLQHKKSINYLDIAKINSKLHELTMEKEKDKRIQFDSPPPYQV